MELVSSSEVEVLSLEGVVRIKRAKANDMTDLEMVHLKEVGVGEEQLPGKLVQQHE